MRATVRLNDDLASHVDDVRQDSETSDAEAVRECIRRSRRVEDLQAEIDDLETTVDRLEREKRLILEQREEHKELANYVEDERTYREQSLTTRLKWWLRGKPADA